MRVAPLRIACLGGGPAGLYLAISMKRRNPAHEVVVIERNRPDDTFGWGVVLSDQTLDNLARNDPESAAAIRGSFAYWDDIVDAPPRRGASLHRPRLLRHRPQAPAANPAGACPRARRRVAVRDRDRERRRLQGLRSDRRRRRHQLQGPQHVRKRVQARHRRARLQVRLARHAAEVRRRLHLHLREDRARLGVGPRLPVRRRHRDVHRRVLGGDLAPLGLRPDGAGRDDRRLRGASSRAISAATS